MTDTDISGAKLRLRRDAIYMKTEKGIIFRGRSRSFSINGANVYQAFRQLVPHLDGTLSADDMLAAVPDAARLALRNLLTTLVKSNLVMEIDEADAASIDPSVAASFAAQIEFIQHYGIQPNRRFQTFRERRILLVGRGRSAVAAGSALLRNGLRRIWLALDESSDLDPIENEVGRLTRSGVDSEMFVVRLDQVSEQAFDLLVYSADEPDFAHLSRLNAEALHKQYRFLPAYIHENRSVIGPLVIPDQPGCWNCALLRWADHSTPYVTSPVWQALAGVRIPQPGKRPVSDLSSQIQGNNLALEIFKYFVGIPELGAHARVMMQDMSSLESTTEMLLPHPECPHCRSVLERDVHGEVSSSDTPTPLQKWAPYLNGSLAMFSGFQDESIEQLPLRVSQLRLNTTRQQSDVGVVYGATGWSLDTSDAARTNAIKAALCHDFLERFPTHLLARGTTRPPDTASIIAPRQILGWLGNCSVSQPGEHFVQITRCRDGATAWTAAGSIHRALDWSGRFDAHSYGLGCEIGSDAIEAARLSAYEYLAVAGVAARSLVVKPLSGFDDFDSEHLPYLLVSAERLGTSTPAVGIAIFERDIAVTVLLNGEARAPASAGILLGSGVTPGQALASLIGRYVAQAQLARQNAHLPSSRPSGLYSHGQFNVEIDKQPFSVSNGYGSQTSQGSPRHSDYEPWWIDVTGPDVALTESMRIVKVLLISKPDRSVG